MPTHVALSDERYRQLDQIAQHFGLSKAEAVGVLINLAYDHALAPRELPGFTISTTPGTVELEIDDPDDGRPAQLVAFAAFSAQIEQTLTPAAAREFADHIERLLDDSGYKGIHEPLAPFKAFRVGTGIAIKSVLDRKRVVPKDVARDLAKMLRLAAGEAEQKA